MHHTLTALNYFHDSWTKLWSSELLELRRTNDVQTACAINNICKERNRATSLTKRFFKNSNYK